MIQQSDQKGQKLYEGKAKVIFATNEKDKVLTYFKDDATAFDGTKKGTIGAKGIVNATMTATLFKVIETAGIPTHLISQKSERELLVKHVQIVPIEVVVRNVAAGSICKRLGLEKGLVFQPPLVEFFYKDDALHDPLITDDHVRLMKLASDQEIDQLKQMALKVNTILSKAFDKVGIKLVDFKLEFGRLPDGKIILADEVSPDTCRLWDKTTGEVLDKDRFRHDMGNVEGAYQEVLRRMVP
jgi:phosphoribosylaminoimidazole-succinocarboxamide synthase